MTTILIVEDDQTVLETLAYNLQQEGYTAVTAANGKAALDLIRAKQPDLVLLDLMLPGLDGLALCRLVRCDPKIGKTPIIMLTARGMQSDKMIGLDSGADDYITKPFELGELLARIRAVLRRAPGAPAAHAGLLSGGDVHIDLNARKAYRGDRLLNLSHKEFDLLTELMRNQGAVLSRDLILSRVWGHDYYGDSRTVDVHISWLRDKIGDDPTHPRYIQTVRGVGYRFEP